VLGEGAAATIMRAETGTLRAARGELLIFLLSVDQGGVRVALFQTYLSKPLRDENV
jgi:hypothetical protein